MASRGLNVGNLGAWARLGEGAFIITSQRTAISGDSIPHSAARQQHATYNSIQLSIYIAL